MYKFENGVPKYYLPFKKDFPWLDYDIAVYCDSFKKDVVVPTPQYLDSFGKCIDYYSRRIAEFTPKSFPDSYRIYIIDNRLNVLFAALDSSGEMATYFSKYGKFGHNFEDYNYGDGACFENFSKNGISYDSKKLLAFSNNYNFVPLEIFASASALVFDESKLVEQRLLSQFQTCLLLEKFKSENLVDWDALVQYIKDDVYFF